VRWILLFIFIALLALGCDSGEKPAAGPPAVATVAAPIDPWLLTANNVQDAEPALLWNGLIGIRLGRDATGLAPDGKKLPFFAIHEYQTEGEEKIVQLANPLCLKLTAGGQALDPTKGAQYQQSIDMGTGIMDTRWEQKIGEVTLKIAVRTAIHPEQRLVGDQWTLSASAPLVIDGISDLGGLETKDTQKSSGELLLAQEWEPRGMKVAARLTAQGGADAKSVPTNVRVEKGQIVFHGAMDDARPATFERVYSFGETAAKIDILALRGIALRMPAGWDNPAPVLKFSELTAASAKVWQERWKTDIEIDGPKEDQLAVRSFLFYLRSAIHPEGIMSVSPMGLSNQQYNGHVFWDADLWVFPALAFIEPAGAIQIVHYRQALQDIARQNYMEWVKAGRPTAGKPLGPMASGGMKDGMKFPWESSTSGKETVPGPSKFEDHITGTVAFSQDLAAHLGLMGREQAQTIIDGAAAFYLSRSEKDAEGVARHIRGTMSPDEHHTGDNDLYTNLVAQFATNGGSWSSAGDRPKYALVEDGQSLLTYEQDALKGYKQAAAVLSIFPLQYPLAEKQAKVMMDRFADKVTENGPAMSDSIHATIWARIGEKDRAYETWRKSWQPFTNLPLMLFSEKRSKAATYFTTGAAGSLQTVLYGFLGFRLDSEQEPGAAWSKKLNGDAWLSIKPNLPTSWKSVTFKNFKLLGESYTLTATPTAAKVARGE
jgi:trehalose/maltose hydrolase-like predicted phosphorylase